MGREAHGGTKKQTEKWHNQEARCPDQSFPLPASGPPGGVKLTGPLLRMTCLSG